MNNRTIKDKLINYYDDLKPTSNYIKDVSAIVSKAKFHLAKEVLEHNGTK